MKKRVFGRKFSREKTSRIALFRGLIKAFILSGKMVTTLPKAKAIQGDIDKLVRLGKRGDLAAKRQILSELANDQKSLEILVGQVANTFSGKLSGFTKIIKLPPRKGDNAEMARLEWSQPIIKEEAKSKPKIKKKITKK